MNTSSINPQLQELLVRAESYADNGRWAEARNIYSKICKLQPDNDDAWFMCGSLSIELGESERAMQCFDRALGINHAHPDALYLKASLVLMRGDADTALELIHHCVDVDPEYPEAWALLGRLQGAAGHYTEALVSSERVLDLDPGLIGAQLTKAQSLQSLGRLSEAVEAYRSVIASSPDQLDLYCVTGQLLVRLNRWVDAEDSFSAALRLDPQSETAHEGLGTVYSNIGRWDAAERHLQQALQHNPALPDAHKLLANVLRKKGDLRGALHHWSLIAEADPEDESSQTSLCMLHWELGNITEALAGCLDVLEKNPVNLPLRQILPKLLDDQPYRNELRDRVRAELIKSFGMSGLDCDTLFRPSLRILQQDPVLTSIFKSLMSGDSTIVENGILSDHFSPLFNDKLFLNILCNATVCDVGVENMLSMIRAACLNIVFHGNMYQENLISFGYTFLASLACQCFHTGYSYLVTSDQEDKLEQLEHTIISSWRRNETLEHADIVRIIVYAMYRPLHGVEYIEHIGDRLRRPGVESLNLLVKRQIEDVSKEIQIRCDIPKLTTIESALSRQIEAEYNISPYPRWLSTGVYLPVPYRKLFRRRYSTFEDPGVDPHPLKMLVAGCGTGRHAIIAATRFDDAEVLAIDLSASSLAYGQRMAGEMSINNVSFQQADIMELNPVTQKFNIIEAGGVLHNMDKPAETIRLFSDLLEEKGLLHVSTYRKKARKTVLMARELIRKNGRPKTPDGIRQARQDIITMAYTEHSFSSITRSKDFFTLSEARYLLFDVHEHTFEMDELYAMLHASGLRMIGFDLNTFRDYHSYRLTNPDDPSVANQEKVRAFEINNPSAFTSQYHFWCQKV